MCFIGHFSSVGMRGTHTVHPHLSEFMGRSPHLSCPGVGLFPALRKVRPE